MGFRLTWLGFRGTSRARLCNNLGLCQTGQFSPLPWDQAISVAQLANWHIVVADDDRGRTRDPDVLNAISTEHEILVCGVHEGIMYSHAAFWSDGRQRWSVTHDAAGAKDALDIAGTLPPLFTVIYDELKARQDQEPPGPLTVNHVFDVPVALCAPLTGYRHDRLIGKFGDMPFEILEARD